MRRRLGGQGTAMTKHTVAETLREAVAVTRLAHHGLTLNEQTLESFSDGVAIADISLPDTPVIYVNSAIGRITGYDVAELLGHNCRFLQGTDRQQPEIRQMAAAIRERRDIDVVLRNYRKDGTLFWNELRLRPLRDTAGNVRHYLAVMRDVTASRELTGLLTRRGFLAGLDEARHDTDMVVLCCDTD
ncbi:MAG: PAS domain-containing protein, partial [Acetobacteraceae bacterium]